MNPFSLSPLRRYAADLSSSSITRILIVSMPVAGNGSPGQFHTVNQTWYRRNPLRNRSALHMHAVVEASGETVAKSVVPFQILPTPRDRTRPERTWYASRGGTRL